MATTGSSVNPRSTAMSPMSPTVTVPLLIMCEIQPIQYKASTNMATPYAPHSIPLSIRRRRGGRRFITLRVNHAVTGASGNPF